MMKYVPSVNNQLLVSSLTETNHNNNNDPGFDVHTNNIPVHNHHLYSSYQQQTPAYDTINDANDQIRLINTSSYTHQCKTANIDWSRKLSFRYQRIKDIYDQFRTSVSSE